MKWARDSHLRLFPPAALNIVSRRSFRWPGWAPGGLPGVISCLVAGKVSVGVSTTPGPVCGGLERLPSGAKTVLHATLSRK